jgi:polyhydroxyalkanoate synthesis regulator phasin
MAEQSFISERKAFLLKTPLQLGQMSKDDLIRYVDELHNHLKNYQIIVDQAVSRNLKIR